uniref:Uncharacterized protein n=1 Tax=Onchocerca volvulus TaxID=6282 RepID=A0A8R1TXU9_ONCVO
MRQVLGLKRTIWFKNLHEVEELQLLAEIGSLFDETGLNQPYPFPHAPAT